MKEYMTRSQALELMTTATNVAHWNELREQVKESVDPSMQISIIASIDTSGMIVPTLKAAVK